MQFQVNGFKHQGKVRVIYNGGNDLFDIVLLDRTGKETRREEGVYLDERLGEYGMKISAKTEDEWAERGAGILRYLEEHPEISRFVILDDYSFDFREQGLLPFWVRTDFEEETGGLQEKHVKQAARILKLQDHGIFCVKEILARKKKKKGGWLSRLLTGGNGKND